MYRELYSVYLDIPNVDSSESGFVPLKCPFHEDHKPSAGINLKTGVFNCYKCGSLSPIALLVKLDSSLDPTEASAILDDYRRSNKLIEHQDTFINHKPPSPRFDSLLRDAMLDPTSALVQDYCNSRGITPKSLQDLGVTHLPTDKTSWKRDSLVFPYTVDRRIVGIRYRDSLGNKGGEPGCYFTLWGIDSLDNSEAEVAVVCEGESDRLRTYQALRGLDKCVVVSTPTATFRQEWDREFEGYQRVILIPHADEASLKMVQKAQAALPDKLFVLKLPWQRKQIGKDVCDWMRYHKDTELEALVKSAYRDIHKTIVSGFDFHTHANRPRRWLIKGLLARRQVAVIAGQPKSFKTWAALSLIRTLLSQGSEELWGIPELTGIEDALNVLIVEEEGDEEELHSRVCKTLDGIDWQSCTFWAHHLGIRLDEPTWVTRLEKVIEEYKIDVIVFDPFHRTHSQDENSATGMGSVWDTIHHLTSRFENLSVIILHHFTKTGSISDGWKAFRGSSRTAAEADLGIFVDLRPSSDGVGIKVKFDGRSIPQICTESGKDVFRLTFHADRGALTLDTGKISLNKTEALVSELEDRGLWMVTDAAKFFGVSTNTIYNWINRSNGKIILHRAVPGQPSAIILKEENNGMVT